MFNDMMYVDFFGLSDQVCNYCRSQLRVLLLAGTVILLYFGYTSRSCFLEYPDGGDDGWK